MDLGERIRATREARGLKQADVARAIGIQPQSLWRIEAGEVKDPGVSVVGDIAQQLGVTVDFLLRGEEDLPPAKAS